MSNAQLLQQLETENVSLRESLAEYEAGIEIIAEKHKAQVVCALHDAFSFFDVF
jgi:hypothetical protein